MKDQFQRTIDYARISITDRCNLYCTYCRPDHEEMLSHGEILRYEEILRAVSYTHLPVFSTKCISDITICLSIALHIS